MPPRANWKKLLTSFDFAKWLEDNPDLISLNTSFPALNKFYASGDTSDIDSLLIELTTVSEDQLLGYVQHKYPALVRHIASGDVANMRRLSAEMNLMQPVATSRAGFVVRFIAAVLG
jgi:hypothetical protein